jgi:hypothetical protein
MASREAEKSVDDGTSNVRDGRGGATQHAASISNEYQAVPTISSTLEEKNEVSNVCGRPPTLLL